MKFRFIILLWLLSIFTGCKNSPREKSVHLFAAAGTIHAVNQLVKEYSTNNDIRIRTNFSSSGALANQIKGGANADIFISANKSWMDYLGKQSSVVNASITPFAKNQLVLISPKKAKQHSVIPDPNEFKNLLTDQIICMGDPGFAPLGIYTQQWFDSIGFESTMAKKTIHAKDANAVLKYVELGEADYGIVYGSLAMHSDRIEIVHKINTSYHQPIFFYMALLKNAAPPAKNLYNFFLSDTCQQILNRNGFLKLNSLH